MIRTILGAVAVATVAALISTGFWQSSAPSLDLPPAVLHGLQIATTMVLTGFFTFAYWHLSNRFRDDARLFDLHRHQRDMEADIRIRLAARLGDLEDRVARLEDPYGKKKRGGWICGRSFEGVPGLKTFEDYTPPVATVTGDDSPPAAYVFPHEDMAQYTYQLGDDGELTAGKENGDG